MTEESLEDLDVTVGASIETIAEELAESINDRFNQFYLSDDILQSSIDDYEGRNDDEESED
jgi:hypothetical protein